MSKDNNISSYSAADIEKYQKGLLSAKEMHAMEKAALDDPFLADAMEGYAAVDTDMIADVNELRTRLNKKTTETKVVPLIPKNSSSIPWLRIAAMVILLAGAAYLTYQVGFKAKDNTTVAQQLESKDKESASSTTIPFPQANTDTNTNTNVPENKKRKPEEANINNKTENAHTNGDSRVMQEPASVTNESANDIAAERADTILSKKIQGIRVEPAAPTTRNANKEEDAYTLSNRDNRVAGGVDKLPAKKSTDNNSRALGFTTANRSNIFRGRVQDMNNAALPFVNITNTKDNVGTYSDANGNFVLTSPDSVLNVQVRSLGYNNSNVLLRNVPSGNNIVLQDDNHQLTEIVVSNRNANSNRSRSNTMVMEEPEPVDGWENYDTYIANNLVMPDILKSKETNRGQVELSFEVDKDGRPVNITVVKSLCNSCDQEAIRLIKEGPPFKQKSKRKGRTSVTVSF